MRHGGRYTGVVTAIYAVVELVYYYRAHRGTLRVPVSRGFEMDKIFSIKNAAGVVVSVVFVLFAVAMAQSAQGATNISSSTSEHWAWNDFVGWMDFYNTNTVTVASTTLSGYASSSVGDISLDCHTTRIGNICGASNYQVTNDLVGDLTGWGWNDSIGWISFDCHNHNGCGTSNYQVLIDPDSGRFQNYAWNDMVGWISFNCVNTAGCGVSDYKVATIWYATSTIAFLDSSVFNTGVSGGAQLNSILWHGSQASSTAVRFQFAASNSSSGPWNYTGPDLTGNTYYITPPDVSLPLDYSLYNNQRYFRYRVTLASNRAQTVSPRVDDVIINWSP